MSDSNPEKVKAAYNAAGARWSVSMIPCRAGVHCPSPCARPLSTSGTTG